MRLRVPRMMVRDMAIAGILMLLLTVAVALRETNQRLDARIDALERICAGMAAK